MTPGELRVFREGTLPATMDRRGRVMRVGRKYVYVKGTKSGIEWRVELAKADAELGVVRSRLHR